jgi:hypothetical protein
MAILEIEEPSRRGDLRAAWVRDPALQPMALCEECLTEDRRGQKIVEKGDGTSCSRNRRRSSLLRRRRMGKI